jgi:hypothetical protein
MSDHLPAAPLPIAASRQAPNTATYYYADGRAITLHGDRPYRNNNPGNLRFMGKSGSARAQSDGALGVEQGGFAMFPSVAAGEHALDLTIARAAASGRSLTSFVNQYAPSTDQNNTAAYIGAVASALGVKASATLDTLSPAQRAILAQTIMMQEGGPSHGHESASPTLAPPKPR